MAIAMTGQTAAFGEPKHRCENAHWYDVVTTQNISWMDAKAAAIARGGYLATITSASESDFVRNLVILTSGALVQAPSGRWLGPWLGGFQPANSSEPGDGWSWANGEAWGYTNWDANQPDNNQSFGAENYLHLSTNSATFTGTWNDRALDDPNRDPGYVVEYDSLFASRPQGRTLCRQQSGIFSVSLIPGATSATVKWRWRRSAQEQWEVIGDGWNGSLNSVAFVASGGSSPSLTLSMGTLATGLSTTIEIHCWAFSLCSEDVTPPTVVKFCRMDFNCVGSGNVQGILDFLAAWFAGLPAADFNGIGGVSVQDVFDFLAVWFGGCP